VPTTQQLDTTFAALADPTRRAILTRLASGDASVMELAAPFSISQPAISKHLEVLERAGLISRGRDGQRRPCRIEAKPLAEADAWIERYREIWEGSFKRLDDLLEEMKAKEKKRGHGVTKRNTRKR
jgi:DNA-binding transcriptional ArsR family regulator